MPEAPGARLGAELRTARENQERSLRDVARSAEISTAYLQKLERGAVEQPSPKVLQRLSEALGLSYQRLMEVAGFVLPPSPVRAARGVLEAKLATAQLTEVEERAVAAFVESLISARSTADPRAVPDASTSLRSALRP